MGFEMSAMSVKMERNENNFEGYDIFIGFSYNFILNVRSLRSSKCVFIMKWKEREKAGVR